MKEYKVVTLRLGLTKRSQKFEDLMNQYARDGWKYVDIPNGWSSVIQERDKSR